MNGPQAIGAIALSRKEVKPFVEAELRLVESFAAQAVIAIENSRQFREVQDRLEREKASSEILGLISRNRDDEKPVFDVILANASQLCNASVAALVLLDEARTELTIAALQGSFRNFAVGTSKFNLDGDFGACLAVRETRIVHRRSTRDIQNVEARRDLEDDGVRAVLWVPLMRANEAIGVLGLFRPVESAFSDSEIGLVKTFAAQAVIAIENVRQFRALADRTAEVEALNASLETRVSEQVDEIERMGRLKRFLPAAVADTVVSSGSEKMLSSHRALLGVLFCDIRGFTAFCETAEPEETIEVLQTYHQEMGKLINAHGAGVDHRMGDGIMVLFNDPLPCDDPAGEAVRLAIAMRARMTDLCGTWKRMGYRLGFGVGVSLGYATVGMVGFEGRFDYTASGTAINLASRLCDEAEDGEILLSPRAAIAVEDTFQVGSRGELSLKGLREPIEVFRLAIGSTT